MRGLVSVGLVALASFLRCLAWLPLNVGWAISWCADWCEMRGAQ